MNTLRPTKFNLGDQLKDWVSGFSGVVMGITHYATGCIHYGLAARTVGKNGTPMSWEWFDESRLKLVRKNVANLRIDTPTSGPDMNPACK